jgi:hypothetical protein
LAQTAAIASRAGARNAAADLINGGWQAIFRKKTNLSENLTPFLLSESHNFQGVNR